MGCTAPLIAALFDSLPEQGGAWSAAQRQAWLNMMSETFTIVYGEASGGAMPAARATPAPAAKPAAPKAKFKTASKPKAKAKPAAKPAKLEPPFYIGKDDMVRMRGGTRITPDQVAGDLVDLRGMNGDLGKVIWADDAVGLPKGVPLNVTISES